MFRQRSSILQMFSVQHYKAGQRRSGVTSGESGELQSLPPFQNYQLVAAEKRGEERPRSKRVWR